MRENILIVDDNPDALDLLEALLESWDCVLRRAVNGIEIRYKAGYGDAPEAVPSLIRQAMRQMTAHLYMHRGDDSAYAFNVSGAGALLQSYRILGL